jgi:hypothetical protein
MVNNCEYGNYIVCTQNKQTNIFHGNIGYFKIKTYFCGIKIEKEMKQVSFFHHHHHNGQ